MSDSLVAFYQNRASNPFGEKYDYDENGDLIVRNGQGQITNQIMLPTYRPVSIEEYAEMEKEHLEKINEANQKYEDARRQLHAAMNNPQAELNDTLMNLNKKVKETDAELIQARFAHYNVTKHLPSKLKYSDIDYSKLDEHRKYPYYVYIVGTRSFKVENQYVRIDKPAAESVIGLGIIPKDKKSAVKRKDSTSRKSSTAKGKTDVPINPVVDGVELEEAVEEIESKEEVPSAVSRMNIVTKSVSNVASSIASALTSAASSVATSIAPTSASVKSAAATSAAITSQILIDTGKSQLILHNLSPVWVKRLSTVVKEIDPTLNKNMVYGKEANQNKSVGFYSDKLNMYKSNGRVSKSKSLTPSLKELLEYINKKFNVNYNGVLIRKYESGGEIENYENEEKQLDKEAGVISISVGAIRQFVVRDLSDTIVLNIPTDPKKIIQMTGEFQSEFKHEIPEEKEVAGTRYSFTFRI